MHQYILTIEDNTQQSFVEKLISLIPGVKIIPVQNKTDVDYMNDPELAKVPEEIRSIIGIGAHITEKDIANDERLAYILSK